jgi:hypothetical protein
VAVPFEISMCAQPKPHHPIFILFRDFFKNTDMMAQPRENGMPDSRRAEKSREEKTPNGRAGFMQLGISMKLGGSLNGGERENDV